MKKNGSAVVRSQLQHAAAAPGAPIEVEVAEGIGAGELAQALSLLEEAYPRIDREVWRWQYAQHYLGPPQVAVARADGRIVGLQPSIRHEVWWRGRRSLAYQLCHVVTHPDWRRRGIFTALIGAFAAHAEREGACCVYTFPNRLSYPGFQRARSWEHPFSLPLMARTAFGSGSRGSGRSRGAPGEPIGRFDAGVDHLGETLPERHAAGRVRDHRYLNWRYIDHPHRPYVCMALRDGPRWQAVAIGRLMPWSGVRAGLIVEVLGDPSSLDHLLASLEKALVERGAQMLGCLMFRGREEAEVLRRRGYRHVPAWAVRKEFYFVARAQGGLPGELRQPSAWWLTWGDNDTV